MVFSNRKSLMVIKLKYLISGSQEVTLGKLRDKMSLIQLDSLVTSENITMEELKEQTGKAEM